MPVTVRELLLRANAQCSGISSRKAMELHGGDDVMFVDVRDADERRREGVIPGSLHLPRAFLEFHVDPASPLHRPEVGQASNSHLVVYCSSGMRSPLAALTLKEMGMERVSHLSGGFQAWKQGGGPTEAASGEREPSQAAANESSGDGTCPD